jgi:ribosomal protein L29
MLQAKKELEVKLEQLQARLETLRAAETVSKLSIDDSNLSHARQLIADLNKQLDVKQKLLDAEGKFAGLIPVESTTTAIDTSADTICEQIDAYLNSVPTDAAVAQGQ